MSDRSRDQSVDQRDSREQPGSWRPAERKKNQHISWKQPFTSFIGSVVYQKQFCQNSIYNLHIFQKATQNSSHIQAAQRDKFLTLKTCTIKLNMVIKIHNNVKPKWVMQIIKANKDIAVISVYASVCVCVSANKNKPNILMTFGRGGYTGTFSLFLPHSER